MTFADLDACDTARSWFMSALVVAGFISVAPPAAAEMEISIRPAHEAPVELLLPASNEILVSGRETMLAWRPLRDLAADGIHEWEAFLSFDDGNSWPIRITPHLNIARSSFHFAVPLVPSDHVRLLLRFGDERREVGYLMPIELRSVAATGTSLPLSPSSLARARGERARPEVAGVVVWVEGDRDGRQVETRTTTWQLPAVRTTEVPGGHICSTLTSPHGRTLDLAARFRQPERLPIIVRAPSLVRRTLRHIPLLLLLCRQNE